MNSLLKETDSLETDNSSTLAFMSEAAGLAFHLNATRLGISVGLRQTSVLRVPVDFTGLIYIDTTTANIGNFYTIKEVP